MRLFATDRVMKLLDTLGYQEGDVIEHKMVNNAIEKAQRRVEENNFGIRKRLVEYDDVMNKQRNYIYTRRQHALKGERLGIDIANMIYDSVEALVDQFDNAIDYPAMALEIYRIFAIEPPFDEKQYSSLSRQERVDALHDAAMEALNRKDDRIREIALPVIKSILENNDYRGKIIVPVSDGKRQFNLRIDLEEAMATEGRCIIKEWQKALSLVTIDDMWMNHLRELDQLRQSVQNASYEQKDPLVIYKVEAFNLFQDMLGRLNAKMVSALMRAHIPVREAATTSAPQPQQHNVETEVNTATETSEPEPEPQPQPKPKPAPELKEAGPEMPHKYNYSATKASVPARTKNVLQHQHPRARLDALLPSSQVPK